MEGRVWRSDMYQDSVVRLYPITLVTTINLGTLEELSTLKSCGLTPFALIKDRTRRRVTRYH